MATYSIRDLEKLSGVKAHTIRIWEKRYNLVEPMRTSTNIRYYCDEDLKKLLNISILNKNGFKISQIASLEKNELNDKVIYIINDLNENDSRIESLIVAMIELDETKFEKILNQAILKYGFETTIIETLYPFLERIGILWQIGKINPAQEHFITNLIRQKLIVAIDGVIQSKNIDSKKFIMFLPEGELHEISLLVYHYCIKKNGHKVIYLGQSVPFKDLVEVEKIKPADYLFTSIITSNSQIKFNEYLFKLSNQFDNKTIFITGKQASILKKNNLKNIKIASSPNNFLTQIS